MVQISEPTKEDQAESADNHSAPHHPAFGFMKGLLTVAPGVDVTAPTCPHWEAYAEKKYGPESELGKLLAKFVETELARVGGEESQFIGKS